MPDEPSGVAAVVLATFCGTAMVLSAPRAPLRVADVIYVRSFTGFWISLTTALYYELRHRPTKETR